MKRFNKVCVPNRYHINDMLLNEICCEMELIKDKNSKYVHVVLAPSFCGENDFFLEIVKLVKILEDFRAPDMIKRCE